MADCTVRGTTYGYWAGDTGTDETTVNSGIVSLKGILCLFTASAHTVTVKSKSDGKEVMVVTSTPSNWNVPIPFFGSRLNGITVTLSNTTARALFFTT